MRERKKLLARARFTREASWQARDFTSSLSFDYLLYKEDIQGSIAHAEMLARVKIISAEEAKKIVRGLRQIEKEIEPGKIKYDTEEDIHMFIEKQLIEKIGKAGEKLHTARSRNDQISLDMRLYIRSEIGEIIGLISELQRTIIQISEKNIEVIMPGYTHLQPAQPVLFSHHLMSYYFMLKRDKDRLLDCRKRVNILPLGCAALAGTSLPIDRKYVARMLGLSAISENSIDAVSDRDFIIEFVSCLSFTMMHLSRLSEELILWSSREFDFIQIGEEFSFSSSIMPQKKNPDIPELARGKTSGVYANLFSLFVMMKGLPLSYNRDLQEDKIPLFSAVNATRACLKIYPPLLKSLKINKEKMFKAIDPFSVSADLVEYLVKKKVSFRTAYNLVGKMVKYCLQKKKAFRQLSLAELKSFSKKFNIDAFKIMEIKGSLEAKNSPGGTSTKQVRRQIAQAKKGL